MGQGRRWRRAPAASAPDAAVRGAERDRDQAARAKTKITARSAGSGSSPNQVDDKEKGRVIQETPAAGRRLKHQHEDEPRHRHGAEALEERERRPTGVRCSAWTVSALIGSAVVAVGLPASASRLGRAGRLHRHVGADLGRRCRRLRPTRATGGPTGRPQGASGPMPEPQEKATAERPRHRAVAVPAPLEWPAADHRTYRRRRRGRLPRWVRHARSTSRQTPTVPSGPTKVWRP